MNAVKKNVRRSTVTIMC